MTPCEYCFELKSKVSELETLCRHLEDCGNLMELPQKCRSEINLGLAKVEETPVVEVEDDGRPFNPLEAAGPAADRNLGSINIGGLGIHLMKKVVDDIDYQRIGDKNKLTLKKCVAARWNQYLET